MSTIATAAEHRGARVRVPPPLVFLAALVTAIVAQQLAPLGLPLPRIALAAFGGVVAAAGIATVASARILFFKTGQSPTPWSPTPELIAGGPYRFTRNPMYVGVTTFLIGLGIALGLAWLPLCALGALAVVHHIAVVREEAYLVVKFGERYSRYCASVPRYL